LSEVFCVDVYAYAIMSNHYHLVVRVDPSRAKKLSDKQVAERWNQVYAWASTKNPNASKPITPERVPILRQRLGSLSWFMKALNEPIARVANAEDECKGHFWEGRFKCLPLLDERAVLACMTYVELNPVRSGEVSRIDKTKFTSARRRLAQPHRQRKRALGPVFSNNSAPVTLSVTTNSFFNLLKWSTGQLILKTAKRARGPTTLRKSGISTENWIVVVSDFLELFRTAAGSFDSCTEFYSMHDRTRLLDRRGRELLYQQLAPT